MAFDFATFLDYTRIFTLDGFGYVLLSLLVGVLLAIVVKRLMGLAIALGALVAIFVLTGVATFSLSSVSTLATEVYQFLAGYAGSIEVVVMKSGIDGTIAAIVGFLLGYFGIPGLLVKRD